MKNLNLYSEEILNKSKELRFNAIGTTPITTLDKEYEKFYYNWLKNKFHAGLQYMEKNAAQRFAPEMLLDKAKTAIVILVSYNQEKPKLNSHYKIARYAVGLDYHFVIKSKLQKLLEYIQTIEPKIKGRAFVDSAPIPERYLASKAGLGFIGKNGLLINPVLGSFVFIGQLYIDAELIINASIKTKNNKKIEKSGYTTNFENCLNCDLCIKCCPNGAIITPGVIDSARCISYKTIEYKGEIEKDDQLAGYIFGCDICQQVCPYNKDIKIKGWQEFTPSSTITSFSDDEWDKIASNQFKRMFRTSPIQRSGLKKIKRNIDIIKK